MKPTIKTSYFAKYKGDDGVCIAIIKPFYFKGTRYKALAPTLKLLHDYKMQDITWEDYKIEYNKQLEKLDAKQVAKELDGKVLLCYEKDRNNCHRSFVAEWLEKNADVICEEL
jgi:uncharacterized protein YeaO (DUF488 family)